MPKTKYPIFKSLHRGEKGFTLIELLIVVAILGIIAAVVIPNIAGFMATGNQAAANTEAENVKTASLAFYADNQAWPTDSDDLLSAGNVTGYITGTLKAVYTFDGTYGWLMTGTPTDQGVGLWTGITFSGANSGPDGNHGTWQKS